MTEEMNMNPSVSEANAEIMTVPAGSASAEANAEMHASSEAGENAAAVEAARTAHPLSVDEIKEIIPHRYPFLLIDQVVDYEPGKFADARKCVTVNEPFFQGHFPQYPVMPGVLIIEALAQTGAVALLSMPENKGKIALFGGIKNARFKKQVRPGDVLELHCELTRMHGPVGMGTAVATVNGKTAVQAELTFAVQ